VIPVLLLSGTGLYKTTKFSKPVYLGDPLNILKIFNEKGVDEVVVCDIGATEEKRRPHFDLLKELAAEAFMPLGYFGGVRSVTDAQQLLSMGYEKIGFNTHAFEEPAVLEQLAKVVGVQSVAVCLDFKKTLFGGYELKVGRGRQSVSGDWKQWVQRFQNLGVGEFVVQSIDRDGQMSGYDLDLIQMVSKECRVPVIALGGAAKVDDLRSAIASGAHAAAAGSMFVFQGKHRAVLISYPSDQELQTALG
jgi:cyclase